MLDKKEVKDIQFEIEKGILGVNQYEFICLRLIDTIKQLEEQMESLILENGKLRQEKELMSLDSRDKYIKLCKIKDILCD